MNEPNADAERLRVLVAEPLPASGLAPLEDARIEVVHAASLERTELIRTIAGFDALVVRSGTRVDSELLAAGTRLRAVGRAGVGVDNIDVQSATAHGIAVLNAPTGNTISAAELTFALLLSVLRKIPSADRSMRAGEWDRSAFRGVELSGRTLGLIGAGRIGAAVARRAHAFQMKVLAYDPYLTSERAQALEVEPAGLDELLTRADVVTVHVPLTSETRGLLGERRLRAMKADAVLVNAARGGIVDEAALAHVLADGHLAGAALDVYEEEPLPAAHALRSAPRLVLTPHLGASTAEAQHNVAHEVASAVRDALLDGDYSRAINAPAVGGETMRRLGPLLELARRLGLLLQRVAAAPVSSLDLHYAGDEDAALAVLAPSALSGLLHGVVGRNAVNLVNALYLAEARGIEVRSVRRGRQGDYQQYIELIVGTSAGERRAGGALLGESHARLVRLDDYHVDVRPRGTLLVLRNRDVPGVIGRVGSVLGDAGINIGEYHQSRLDGDGDALATVSVDGEPGPMLIERLSNLPDVIDVRVARLD